jgi:hypothetical protein
VELWRADAASGGYGGQVYGSPAPWPATTGRARPGAAAPARVRPVSPAQFPAERRPRRPPAPTGRAARGPDR